MQDRHEPSDHFIERLGQDIGAEVRRRNRQPKPAPWWQAAGLKTLAEELGDTYQCDVTLDTERARASSRSCPIVRRPTYTTPAGR